MQTNNKNRKKKLNENWVAELWNNSQHFGDWSEGSGVQMTYGQVFRTAVGVVLGIGATAALHYGWNKITNAAKSAPEKAKKIMQAAKIIRQSKTSEDAKQQLDSAGIPLHEAFNRDAKIKKIKALVETIQKKTGKKVVFKEDPAFIKRLIERIEKISGKKVVFSEKKEVIKKALPKKTIAKTIPKKTISEQKTETKKETKPILKKKTNQEVIRETVKRIEQLTGKKVFFKKV